MYFSLLAKWLFICVFIGFLVGSASAIFLHSLDWVTQYREDHFWLIYFLPIGGFLVGLLYHYYGKSATKGNHLLLETFDKPKERIPLRMAFFVYLGTLSTHLFGGSAGREGTALQMAGSIAEQLNRFLKIDETERKTILFTAIAAGFGAVFGTPLAGMVFAYEFFEVGKLRYKVILPVILTIFLAHNVALLWQAKHSVFVINSLPKFSFFTFLYLLLAGILFGVCAYLFCNLSKFTRRIFNQMISFPPFRPLLGGLVVVVLIFIFDTTKYLGLGVPTILNAFQNPLPWYDFLLKMVFTIVTLSSGFKGGEVTPLFFIGAALGSAFSVFIPLPVGLLAGLGFVAVFAGAAKTPFTCVLLAFELFGLPCAIYALVVCFVSYCFSGKEGIYVVTLPKKFNLLGFLKID
ncbi:MAG: chloride channel protein [Sphingobacteriaceae bacterium]|nr:chloride channel protein [Sphingobacteriaceae bacterium]